MAQEKFATDRILTAMTRAMTLEIAGLEALAASFDASLVAIVEAIAGVRGRVICAGVGKSGHVARKIAATFASTGTPAQFVHPAEASHGDLGMITPDDIVLALSKSGETRELGDMVAYCRRFGVPLIAMTAGAESSLAKGASFVFLLPAAAEACGETRAPTTSTTMMMAAGDALAVALIEARGFTATDFGRFHPGGSLGAALARVEDVMHVGDAIPQVAIDALMGDALIEMSQKGFGCVGVISKDGRLCGIITDGDLRRRMGPDLLQRTAGEVMTASPLSTRAAALAADALRIMTAGNRKITQLFVTSDDGRPVGLLHIHDLLRIGTA